MSTYKPIDACETVEELLSDPARWTQRGWAKDDEGLACYYRDASAQCFCLDGALRRVYGYSDEAVQAHSRLAAVLKRSGPEIWDWNDDPSRTHAEVLAAVRKAGI